MSKQPAFPPSSSPERRPTLKEWLAVLSVALGAFVMVTSEFLPIGLLTHIAAGVQISAGTAGLMVTIPGLVAAVVAPVTAVAAGRLDRRLVVMGLIALLLVSNTISALAPNFAVMIVGRVLFGVCLGGFWTIAVTLGARLVPKAYMSQATTVILAGVSIATVLGVPAGAFVANLAGWRASFGAVAVASVVIFGTQLFLLPRIPATKALTWSELTHVLRIPDARTGLLAVAFVIGGHFAAYTYVTPLLKDTAGFSPNYLGTLLLVYGVAGIFGNFAGGAASVRHLRLSLGVIVALLAGSILLLPKLGLHPVGAAILLATWGFAFGGVPITLNLWVFKSAPEALEGGAALLVSTFQIFIALGSVLGGRLVDAFGTSAVMWSAGVTVLATLALVVLSRHTTKTTDPCIATPQLEL